MEELNVGIVVLNASGFRLSTSYGGTELDQLPAVRESPSLLSTSYGGTEPACAYADETSFPLSTSYGGTELRLGADHPRRGPLSTSYGGTELRLDRIAEAMEDVFLPPMEELNSSLPGCGPGRPAFLPPMEELNESIRIVQFLRSGLSTSYGGTELGLIWLGIKRLFESFYLLWRN